MVGLLTHHEPIEILLSVFKLNVLLQAVLFLDLFIFHVNLIFAEGGFFIDAFVFFLLRFTAEHLVRFF